MTRSLAALGAITVLLASSLAQAAEIRGDYIEARTADVFTGPCFSNAEVFITGHQGLMAWKITEGQWDGVDLAGLTVAAAVRGSTTFSQDNPAEARTILIIDKNATPTQREALIALARHLGGTRLSNIVDVRTTRMDLTIESHEMAEDGTLASNSHHEGHAMPKAPKASFWAAGLAEIITRPLDETDHFCGNEVVAYKPLSEGVDVLPAYTLANSFRGKGLNTTWEDHNARSCFVGHFAY